MASGQGAARQINLVRRSLSARVSPGLEQSPDTLGCPCSIPVPALRVLLPSRDSPLGCGFFRDCSQHCVVQEQVANPCGEQEGWSLNREAGAWRVQLRALHVSHGWLGWNGMDGIRWMDGMDGIGWMDGMEGDKNHPCSLVDLFLS